MAAERLDKEITAAWHEHRPYLVNLAYRMLGDIADAEDVVQEAFTRLSRAGLDDIEDARGWLIVVTSRLCLDHMRSARARWETALDPGSLESVTGRAAPVVPDPADRVTLDDTVRSALLVVLQRLSPAERVVFVLHDIFQTPFDSVAQTVGRPVATCRQLARRARGKIEAGAQHGQRFDVVASEHRLVTERFITACMNGDLGGLLDVLDPKAWGDADLGPDARMRTAVGADDVARNLVAHWGHGATLVASPSVHGEPVVLAFIGRKLACVLVLTVWSGRIARIHAIADPRRLAFMSTSNEVELTDE